MLLDISYRTRFALFLFLIKSNYNSITILDKPNMQPCTVKPNLRFWSIFTTRCDIKYTFGSLQKNCGKKGTKIQVHRLFRNVQ